VYKFDGDPTVGSKVIALLTCYSNLAGHISLSPSSDSIVIKRKQTTDNRVKI